MPKGTRASSRRRTPFVAAANICIMLMFIWAVERFKLRLLSYECRTEGTKVVQLDRTEVFERLHFRPSIRVAAGAEPKDAVMARDTRAGGRRAL